MSKKKEVIYDWNDAKTEVLHIFLKEVVNRTGGVADYNFVGKALADVWFALPEGNQKQDE
jgi:hypothetical protein